MPAERGEWRGPSAVQLAGLMLWRGGLLWLLVYSLYRAWHYVLRYVDWPLEVRVGVSLALAGAVLVLASLVAERVRDARTEDLTE